MTSKQLEKLAKTIIGSDTAATKSAATPTATSTIAKALPTPKTVNNTSASSTTATNLPPIASKLSPVVSLTPIKVESPSTTIPHGPITGQKRKLSEKSSNETPTLAKKKKDIHQAAVSQQQQQQQQAAAITELLAATGIQASGLNLQNAAVLQEIARQLQQQKLTQQNKKSPSSKKGIAAAI